MRLEQFYTLVGLFVGGAIILMIITGFFVYDLYLHKKEDTYVMFFNGSLSGLDVTSPVTYRGVKIGEVKLIELTEDRSHTKIKIPVYVKFFIEKTFKTKEDPIQILIKQGFAARIKRPNFLTGLASIHLIQDKSIKTTKQGQYHGYPLFPTELIAKSHTSMDTLFKTASQTFMDISEFIRGAKLRNAVDSTKLMADHFDKLAVNLDQIVPGFIDTFDRSLIHFSAAANSMQNLTDYLSQHPESLLRGKP